MSPMCTHYALTLAVEALRSIFDLKVLLEYPVRFNIAPNQTAPIIVREAGRNAPLLARWGFAKGGADMRPVNARCETVASSPLFRDSFRDRRCVVPVSGFYEPRKKPGMKKGDQQWYFRADAPVLALAGIYAEPIAPDGPPTYAVLTTEPNETVGAVHSRMPVILDDSSRDAWLDPAAPPESLRPAMRTRTPEGFRGHRVRVEYVNRPAQHDGPECIEPYDEKSEDPPIQGELF